MIPILFTILCNWLVQKLKWSTLGGYVLQLIFIGVSRYEEFLSLLYLCVSLIPFIVIYTPLCIIDTIYSYIHPTEHPCLLYYTNIILIIRRIKYTLLVAFLPTSRYCLSYNLTTIAQAKKLWKKPWSGLVLSFILRMYWAGEVLDCRNGFLILYVFISKES